MREALSWAVAVALIQMCLVFCVAAYVTGKRAYERHRAMVFERIRPLMEERLTAIALEGGEWPGRLPKRGPERWTLERCLAQALVGLKACGRGHLIHFAADAGFAAEWAEAAAHGGLNERKRALHLLGLVTPPGRAEAMERALSDANGEIRAEAARGVLMSAGPRQADEIVRRVLRESLLVRALLAGDLRRHAASLIAMSGSEKNGLTMLAAWRVAVPGMDRSGWREGSDDEVAIALLNLLPYSEMDESAEDLLTRAFRESSVEIRCAAARSAGEMKLLTMIPQLTDLVSGDKRVATAAATALACMGCAGTAWLEEAVRRADRQAAAAAMEALESVAVEV